MRIDAYIRLILAIIATGLLALVFRAYGDGRVYAAAKTRCSGEILPTAVDPLHASMGASYRILITCE